ncbi:MAG TPA: type II toxin-antitoxin system VapB family antitoxin [Thermoanaerobaculia bacterium]|nr:type II toxin-antitoxin system VapB family antitoxin [Thermoanaerobaculia bacterium]
MALNIKDPVAEKLVAEVAALAGESKTEAVRVALRERLERLALRGPRRDRKAAIDEFLREFWATLPKGVLGKKITKKERERILGYGPHGV